MAAFSLVLGDSLTDRPLLLGVGEFRWVKSCFVGVPADRQALYFPGVPLFLTGVELVDFDEQRNDSSSQSLMWCARLASLFLRASFCGDKRSPGDAGLITDLTANVSAGSLPEMTQHL